jgi:hypothetical protein
MRNELPLFKLFILACAMALSACGGDDSDGSGDTTNTTPTVISAAQVKLSGTIALLAQEQTVQARPAAQARSPQQRTGPPSGNLFQVDQDNVSSLAFEIITEVDSVDIYGTNVNLFGSETIPKVVYTAADPAHEFVYIVFDHPIFTEIGFNQHSDPDRGQVATNVIGRACSTFKVKISNNVSECLALLAVSDQTLLSEQVGSTNVKPIQFDAAGNVYVKGISLAALSEADFNSWNTQVFNDLLDFNANGWLFGLANDSFNELSAGMIRLGPNAFDSTDNTILKIGATNDVEVLGVTTDAETSDAFLVMTDGKIVFKSSGNLNLWQRKGDGTSTRQIIGAMKSQYPFDSPFRVDEHNTILFNNEIFTTPNTTTTGFKKLSLASLFSKSFSTGAGTYSQVADDGNIYSVAMRGIYRIIPFDPEPRVIMQAADPDNAQQKSRIASGLALVVNETTLPQHGTLSSVQIGNLSSGEITTLFNPTDNDINLDADLPYYQITNFKVTSSTAYFSGLDLANNRSVFGEIDLAKFKQGLPESQFVRTTTIESATEANNKINDIEIVAPIQPDSETGSAPIIISHSLDNFNNEGATIQFSKYMDRDDVESKLSFINQDTGAAVPFLTFWVNKSLHLLPDLNDFTKIDGGGNPDTKPLEVNTNYTLAIEGSAFDAFGTFQLADGDTTTFPLSKTTLIKPEGWYTSDKIYTDTDRNGLVVTGKVARFDHCSAHHKTVLTGCEEINNSSDIFNHLIKDLGPNSSNVRVEWSSYQGRPDFGRLSITYGATSNNIRFILNARDFPHDCRIISSDGLVNLGTRQTLDSELCELPETFKRYRIDIIGKDVKFFVSSDGVNFTEITSLNASMTNALTGSNTLKIASDSYPSVTTLDNIAISSLNVDGTLASIVGDLFIEGFEDGPDITGSVLNDGFGLDDAIAD